MPTETEKKALQTAANILQYKNRSKAALYQRLEEKGISPSDALYAVERLETLGFLDDRTYAQTYARMRIEKGYGKRRIRQELRQKGVEENLVEEVVQALPTDLSKMEGYIRSHLKTEAVDRKALKRVADGLFRRGFGWDEIRSALDAYQEQLEEASEE